MCVANGSKGTHWCDERGDPKLFGYCGYCWANQTTERQRKILAEREAIALPPDPVVHQTHQHIHPPVPLWLNVLAWGVGGAVGQVLYQLAGLAAHRWLGW
jgi:hypothetical protein